MAENSFEQPYLSNDAKRSIVGIDCPHCTRKKRAIPLTYVTATHASRLYTAPDLTTRPSGTFSFHYGHPDILPNTLRAESLITFWRCESCDIVFHNAFEGWTYAEIVPQIYNSEYPKTIPQISAELYQFRVNFIRGLFSEVIKNMRILVAESELGGVVPECKVNGIQADCYTMLSRTNIQGAQGIYPLICVFNMLERLIDPISEIKALMKYADKRTLILFSYIPFSFRQQKDHQLLSPRNGFFRLLCPKSIDVIAKRLECNVLHLNNNLFVLYREMPDYASFLLESEFDGSKIVESERANDNDGNIDSEEQNAIYAIDTPVLCSTARVTLRETRYGLMHYYHHDALVGKSLHEYGQYLDSDRELFEQLIRPDWHVVDASANIGVHSMMLSSLLPEGKISAFEPYSMSFRLLQANIALNGLDNVTARQIALGATDETTHLASVHADNPGSLAAKGWDTGFSGEAVPQHKLDSLFDTMLLGQCDFLNICAPEQEPMILQGAAAVLRDHQPAVLVNCVHKNDFLLMQSLLSDLGYRLYWHIQPFFQEDNFFHRSENVFDSAGAAKILALHGSRGQNIGLQEIESQKDWIIPG